VEKRKLAVIGVVSIEPLSSEPCLLKLVDDFRFRYEAQFSASVEIILFPG